MQSRSYRSDSLPEGNRILNSEWSRHQVSVQHGQSLRLRFSIRSITPAMSVSSLCYGAQAVVRPEERAKVLLVQMPRASFDDASTPMDAAHYALIDARSVAQVVYGREADMLVLHLAMERVNARLEEDLGYRPATPLSFARGLGAGGRGTGGGGGQHAGGFSGAGDVRARRHGAVHAAARAAAQPQRGAVAPAALHCAAPCAARRGIHSREPAPGGW
jgi:hypothetical protein